MNSHSLRPLLWHPLLLEGPGGGHECAVGLGQPHRSQAWPGAGAGAEYAISRNVAITADYDHFGKLSRAAKGGLVTVGLRASF